MAGLGMASLRETSISRIMLLTAKSIAILLVLLSGVSTGVNADNLCTSIIVPLGYACSNYTITTSDGFYLGMYRIPYGKAGPGPSPRAPVLLFHGYQSGGDSFLANSATESLGTVLADAGFDVWIGNVRNNKWSHGSNYLYLDNRNWDWTWDEHAFYDVAQSIEFVYNQRGGTKIFYIGHSQGTLTFFASLTNDATTSARLTGYLRGASLLAPFAYNSHVQAFLFKALGQIDAGGILSLLGGGPLDESALTQLLCTNPTVCQDLLTATVGTNNYINQSRLQDYTANFPQVTSTKNLDHFGQTQRSGLFQKYDRGLVGNTIYYHQLTAPMYNWSYFPSNLPLQLSMGGVDQLATPTDVGITISHLPTTSLRVDNYSTYGHVDFVLGYRAYLDVYPNLIDFLRNH